MLKVIFSLMMVSAQSFASSINMNETVWTSCAINLKKEKKCIQIEAEKMGSSFFAPQALFAHNLQVTSLKNGQKEKSAVKATKGFYDLENRKWILSGVSEGCSTDRAVIDEVSLKTKCI